MGEGKLGVAEVRGVCDREGVVVVEKGESSMVDADVDEREVEGVWLREFGMEFGLLGMMRGGRRGRLRKLCTDSSVIFLPRSIVIIG